MSETSTPPERDADPAATETPAATARRLLVSVPMGSLATLAAQADNRPYASLVACAVGHDGTPVLLLSELADHTRNLRADPRASLLLDGTAGLANRLAGERVTLLGRLAPVADPVLRRRFLARHPGAARYEGFADFAYWAMTVERAHLVGGFANAHWLAADDVLPPLPAGYALAEAEASILEHMNAEHRDAIDVYANHLAGRGGQGWRLTGIDRFGIDLRRAGETARVGFAAPVDDAAAAKEALIELVTRARAVAAAPRE
ncbi:MAG: HugZ family protein [Alphaproteobacteria bacterium]